MKYNPDGSYQKKRRESQQYWTKMYFPSVKDFNPEEVQKRLGNKDETLLYLYLVQQTRQHGNYYKELVRVIYKNIVADHRGVFERLKPDFLNTLEAVNKALVATRIGSPYDRGWYRLYRQATTDGPWGKSMEEVLEFTPVIVRDLLSPPNTAVVETEETTLFQQ